MRPENPPAGNRMCFAHFTVWTMSQNSVHDLVFDDDASKFNSSDKSPNGAIFDSPGHRPGSNVQENISSPERASHEG